MACELRYKTQAMPALIDATQPRCPFSHPCEVFDNFAQARQSAGLTYSETLNAWVVSRYADIVKALHHFERVLTHSGITLTVPPDRSILEVVNAVGAGVVSTGQKGTCGTCEVRVLEGEPEHHGCVLTTSERVTNEFRLICVSRCRRRRLVLDH